MTKWPHRFIPAALAALLLQTAYAQTPPAKGDGAVVVKGARGSGESRMILAAKSKILSRGLASSCAFMMPGSAFEEEITLNYMADFGLDDSNSFGMVRFSEISPDGDASNIGSRPSPLGFTFPARPGSARSDFIACGPSDFRFAAGRAHIVRKDKSLALGFEAFDNKDYPKAHEFFKTAY